MIYRCLILSVLIIFLNFSISSQTLTSNPYSYFGLGFIENNAFSENIGAGSAGIAMPSEGFLNSLNPASYAAIDSLGFYLCLGIYGKYSKFQSSGLSEHTYDSNLKYISIGFKASKWWGSSIGLVPFSVRGYYMSSVFPVDGDLSNYGISRTGSGSISRFYYANSFRLTKNLSFGANASYLFGMQKNESQLIYNDKLFDGIVNKSATYFNNLYVDFGLQYHYKFNKNTYYAGFTYSPKQKLNTNYDNLVMSGTDTLFYKKNAAKDFTIPESLGIGLGLNLNDKLKLMADYKTMKWSESGYSYNSVKLKDSWQINAGAEYVHNNKTGRKYMDYVSFRSGFRFEKTYLNIGKKDLNEMAFSAGIGLPIKRSMFNITYEYAIMGATDNSIIQEKYSKITIGFTLKDIWFQKKEVLLIRVHPHWENHKGAIL